VEAVVITDITHISHKTVSSETWGRFQVFDILVAILKKRM